MVNLHAAADCYEKLQKANAGKCMPCEVQAEHRQAQKACNSPLEQEIVIDWVAYKQQKCVADGSAGQEVQG